MSIAFPDNQSSAPLTRRRVLLGLAASSLSAPAIVRASIIMPVRPVLFTAMPVSDAPLTETGSVGFVQAGFVQRLFYNLLAGNLRSGCMTTVLNGRVVSLSEAERHVAYARKNGWLVEPRSLPDDTRITAEDWR